MSGQLPCGGEGCRYRPVEVTHDGETITVMNSADSHRLSAALEELYALREAARAMVVREPTLVMCHFRREENFEPGIGCECNACKAAQRLFDLVWEEPR